MELLPSAELEDLCPRMSIAQRLKRVKTSLRHSSSPPSLFCACTRVLRLFVKSLYPGALRRLGPSIASDSESGARARFRHNLPTPPVCQALLSVIKP